VELDRAVQAAIPRAGDGVTRLHLRDLRVEIDRTAPEAAGLSGSKDHGRDNGMKRMNRMNRII
jgi:hypothetical protein